MAPSLLEPRLKIASASMFLPDILGVEKLTKNEILKDIEEMGILLQKKRSRKPKRHYDSDSDSSIDSRGIGESFYPVKPRKEMKTTLPSGYSVSKSSAEKEDLPMTELLEFLRLVEQVRPDLRDAERERELIELKYQSLRDSLVAGSTKFNQMKQRQEQYIKSLQAILVRNIYLYSSYNHHILMLNDVLGSLNEKSKAIALLDNAIASLSNDSLPKTRIAPSVVISKSSGGEVLLSCGMRVTTPYGNGSIKNIRTADRMIEVQLPHGALYTTFAEIINWLTFANTSFGSSSGCNPIAFIKERWTDRNLQLHLPCDVQQDIADNQELIALISSALMDSRSPNTGSEVSPVTTNPDEDLASTDGDVMSVDEDDEEADGGLTQGVPPADEAKIDLRERLEKYGLLDHDIRSTLSFSMPYAFASADVLPDLVQLRMYERQKRIWRHAISKASTPHLATVLSRKLKKCQAQISRLQDEKVRYMTLVERCGHESVRMSQEMTGTRLNMFTRRVRRRNMIADADSSRPNTPTVDFFSKAKADPITPPHAIGSQSSLSNIEAPPAQAAAAAVGGRGRRGAAPAAAPSATIEVAEAAPLVSNINKRKSTAATMDPPDEPILSQVSDAADAEDKRRSKRARRVP